MANNALAILAGLGEGLSAGAKNWREYQLQKAEEERKRKEQERLDELLGMRRAESERAGQESRLKLESGDLENERLREILESNKRIYNSISNNSGTISAAENINAGIPLLAGQGKRPQKTEPDVPPTEEQLTQAFDGLDGNTVGTKTTQLPQHLQSDVPGGLYEKSGLLSREAIINPAGAAAGLAGIDWDIKREEGGKVLSAIHRQARDFPETGPLGFDYKPKIDFILSLDDPKTAGEAYRDMRDDLDREYAKENQARTARENPRGSEYAQARRDIKASDIIKDASSDLDPTRATNNTFAKLYFTEARGQALEALVNRVPGGNPYNAEMVDLAAGLYSLITRSNIPSERLIQGIIPKSIGRNVAMVQQWLTNDPKGMGQQKFVDRIRKTVQAEMAVANNQIKQKQYERFTAFAKRMARLKLDPEEEAVAVEDLKDIAMSYGIDPEDHAEWIKAGSPRFKIQPTFDKNGEIVDPGGDWKKRDDSGVKIGNLTKEQFNGLSPEKQKRYKELLGIR
jgi:hypothetical protein